MCGRYSLTKPIKTIKEHFQAMTVFLDHSPRYNIAPSQTAPVVIQGDQDLELHGMRWGLIPSWAKEAKIGHRMINARSETVDQKPSFRSSFKQRRCLIPTDGFFEWRVHENDKRPQYIHLNSDGLFAFAGLWSEWNEGEKILQTFTILTTQANRQLKPIHERMPVILSEDTYLSWLDRQSSPDLLKTLLLPYPEGLLTHHEISKKINSPKNDTPDCLEAITETS